ncbi:hypothetical protein TARUN_9435 [Trichoderma arundinaceum]|uniref:Uncharacterized protein n=1 Tax=Trichoderma arundinaceum TaxID=490622 RepID=A0A395NAW7_TRIAR|nr:hypothetical protein TARUN_9435 [Trichoderma arundinaceum]
MLRLWYSTSTFVDRSSKPICPTDYLGSSCSTYNAAILPRPAIQGDKFASAWGLGWSVAPDASPAWPVTSGLTRYSFTALPTTHWPSSSAGQRQAPSYSSAQTEQRARHSTRPPAHSSGALRNSLLPSQLPLLLPLPPLFFPLPFFSLSASNTDESTASFGLSTTFLFRSTHFDPPVASPAASSSICNNFFLVSSVFLPSLAFPAEPPLIATTRYLVTDISNSEPSRHTVSACRSIYSSAG